MSPLLPSAQLRAYWPGDVTECRDALKLLGRVFGGDIRSERFSPARPAPVWAAQNEAEAAAQAYAALTGRHYAGLWRFERGLEQGAAVIVALFDSLSDQLVQEVVDTGRHSGSQPGLLLAEAPVDLMEQAVLRAAALLMTKADKQDAVRLVGDAAFAVSDLPGLTLLGAHASVDAVKGALSRASSVAVLSTHSDGLDLKLSEHATLCGLDREVFDNRRDTRAAPRCIRIGFCHRRDGRVDAPSTQAYLVRPQTVVAGVLVVDACSVLPLNLEANRGRSLGARLIEARGVGALAFNCEVYPGDAIRAWRLGADLEKGEPLGTAIARFNRGNDERISRRMVYVGDPELALSRRFNEPSPEPEVRTHSDRMRVRDASDLLIDLAFMRRCARHRPVVPRRIEVLDAIEEAALLGLNIHSAVWRRWLQAVAAYLRAFDRAPTRFPQMDWLTEARLTDSDEPLECFSCGAVMRSYRARFGAASLERVYGHCPQCSAFLDRPATAEVILKKQPTGRIELDARYRGYPAGARFFAHAPFEQGRRVSNWPRDAAGGFAPHRATPPQEAWICGVVISWGVQFAAAATRASWWRG